MFKKIILKLRKYSWKEIISLVDSKYGLGALEKLISLNWFNPLLTIYLNLRSFPLKQAIKLPFFVYGRPKIYCLSGRMIIEGNKVSPGMIKFNLVKPGAPSNMSVQSEVNNQGLIVFNGKCFIGTGTKIFVLFKTKFELGDDIKIADFCNIGCLSGISIGSHTRITHRCQILDSNYHFIANFNSNHIPKYSAPIIIGKYCWICNTSTLSSGAILPDNTIVASNSLVGKDFSSVGAGVLLGGVPAKLISTKIYRVFNEQKISDIFDFYKNNPDSLYIINENDNVFLYSLKQNNENNSLYL